MTKATDGGNYDPSPARTGRPLVLRIGLWACLTVLVSLPGCNGCLWSPSKPKTVTDAEKARAEQRERLRKKPKPNFELGFIRSQPGETPVIRGALLAAQPHEAKPRQCFVKPGHWTMATLPAKANNFAMLGELETKANNRRGPIPLERLPFTVTSSRSAALPKGQPKRLDTVLYIPPTDEQLPGIDCRLNASKGGRGGWHGTGDVVPMPSHQYHFVVLADSPEHYTYVRKLDVVKSPIDLDFETMYGSNSNHPRRAYYQVWLLEPGRRTALPSHGLFWTSIAYLLWDDVDPDRLSLDQQIALLDWLHWGGQLIVSGPETLDTLAGSFLAPYLPVTAATTREITAVDLEELNRHWTVPGKASLPLEPVQSWAGAGWTLQPGAQNISSTGDLFATRNVGRGRVVVSAFRLSQREFTAWGSRHAFFNGCLLGRPPRKFSISPNDGALCVTWADPRLASRQFDPLLTSRLRYFVRDHGRSATITPLSREMFFDSEKSVDLSPGVGGWNDFSPVANAAREVLTEAAEIEIPDRRFVAWVVGAYLLVLVPLNWLFFRVIGRVEWAWVVAPVIALLCTGTVIRMARLDIGFARSVTEVAVVELQGDYPRGHVARYLALYTSLSTTYQFHGDDLGTQVLPFADAADTETRFGRTELHHQYGKQTSLSGFRIMSNSADMAHAEQMLDLGGTVSLVRDEASGALQVVNGTEYTIHDAGVLQTDDQGTLETTWLGALEPGAIASLDFQPTPTPDKDNSLWQSQRNQALSEADEPAEKRLDLQPLYLHAENTSEMVSGDMRLIGRIDEALPGFEIRPAAPQTQRTTLVVAHLRYGFGKPPLPDKNTRAHVE